MHQRQTSHLRSGATLASVLAFVATLGLTPRTGHAQGVCPTEFKEQTSASLVADGGMVCATAVGKKCSFQLALCPNVPGASCTPQDLKKKTIHASGLCAGGIGKVKVKPNGTGSTCGTFAGVTVKTKKHGAASCKVHVKAKKSKSSVTLLCQPSSSPCSTTTTTTSSTTTTTMKPVCGNGIKEAGEDCDPPCGQGQCGAGQLCNSTCHCVTQAACACGASTPTKLSFTTAVGSGNCGAVSGTSGTLLNLVCAGLYFGGGLESVPLPATVPDMGVSLTKACCSGTNLTLANLTSTDTGSNRNCTSTGCLFGPPLPIPNSATPVLSTCILNDIAANAVGTATCDTGASSLNLPLTSNTFLTGDLLDGTKADRPFVPGTQPCPTCQTACRSCFSSAGVTNTMCTTNADCGANAFCGLRACASDTDCPTGVPCGTTPVCLGGANYGASCTPGSGPLGAAYPTSHDCALPAGSAPIGILPIPFALTTGTSSKPGIASGTQQRVFCGYCRDAANTGCFEGDPHAQADSCPLPAGSLHPCTADSDCTTPNYASCEQRDNGAFHQGPATSITETGVPAGDMTDHFAHSSTLVSVFCIPLTFNAVIDGAADLPGPGAVSLPGHAQILP